MTGDHKQAAQVVQDFVASQPELAELGATQFVLARTWARCYEATNSQGEHDLSREYLRQCVLCLDESLRKGYLKNPNERERLGEDENFFIIKDHTPNFADYCR